MTIKVGEALPSVTLHVMGPNGPVAISTDDLFAGKTVVLFGVPGAFTPTCSAKHLPGYVANAAKIREKGVDEIICLAVNDIFVLHTWGRDQNVDDTVKLVADGSGEFTRAIGLELDMTEAGFGVRCQRFSMVVVDRVVKDLKVEETPAEATVSSAEALLESWSDAYLNRGSAQTGL